MSRSFLAIQQAAREAPADGHIGPPAVAYAAKIVANSLYGVLAASHASCYCPPLADFVTVSSRCIITRASKAAEAAGINVLQTV